jgi:hypothetical protein
VGVVEDAVADRVGQGGVGEVVVPLARWQLAGDDGRAVTVAVLEDLQQVPALLVGTGARPQSSINRTSTRASLPSRRV